MSRKYRILACLLLLAALFLLCPCPTLPDNSGRLSSRAIGGGDETGLGKAFSPLLEQHPDQSGVVLLGNGRDAFVARAELPTAYGRHLMHTPYRSAPF